MTTSKELNARAAEETRKATERRDHRVKLWLLVVSVLTVGALGVAALSENVFTSWRHYQSEYAGILEGRATDPRGRMLADDFRVEMRQVVLPELETVDRCVSCHNGIDDPRMTDVPNPHKVHPGRYLEWHEVNRFGCTSCHRGQGRAMDFRSAKAGDVHWDYPLLPKDLTQASCGVCHSPAEVAGRGGEIYAAGASLFEVKGCRSCHKLGGRGGELGPALDNEGLKVRGLLPMANVKGPHTLPQWLLEHFDDPQKIVAGSRMPQPGLSRTDATALTTFLLSLQQRDLPGSYMSPQRHLEIYARANPAPMNGADTYNRFCASCHDTGTYGRYDKFFRAFIPAIRGETYRQVAEPAYVAANIRLGRRGTIMPAWGPAAGGLSEEEIRLVTSYLLDRPLAAEEIAPGPPVKATALFSPPSTDPVRGERLFARNCTGCHAAKGKGGLGPSLDTPVFQAYASDEFLYRTIAFGRRNTAMAGFFAPEAGGFGDPEIRDLVAYLRTIGPPIPPPAQAAAVGK